MPKKQFSKRRIFVFSILVAAAVILWLGGSIFNLVHNKLEVRRLLHKREQLDAQYQQLLDEKKLLESKDPAYFEMLARTRYHMVKPGEIEFRFKTNDKH